MPHADGKSSWWTVNHSDTSSTRVPRGSNSIRHRSDSMDTRSFVLHRQRRNRKSDSSIRKCNTSTVPLSSRCFETLAEVKSDSLELQDFSDSAAYPSTVASDSLCNMDTFLTRSDMNSILSAETSAFLGSDDQPKNTAVVLSPFHSKVSSPILEPSFIESSVLVEDEYSNVMMTQWNPLEIGTSDLGSDNASASVPESRSLPLFSDDSMLMASQLTDSSQEEPVFCDDRELMLAAYSTVSSPSDQPSYRRGSDAPPPSPESACGEQSSSFEETVSNLAEMKVETSVAAAGNTNTQFATGWTSVFPLKIGDDLSSLSDVDMEH